MKLKRIGNRKDMEGIYKILHKNNFPNLPSDMHKAVDILMKPNVYVYLYKEDYVFVYLEQEKLYLDVCIPSIEGKRMNRDFIYFMMDIGFNRFNYDEIIIEPQTHEAYLFESRRFKEIVPGMYKITSDDVLYGREAIRKYFKRRDRR